MSEPFAPLFIRYREALNRFDLNRAQLEKLETFLHLLWAENKNINLFSRRLEPDVLFVDHLLDSLLGLAFLPEAAWVADLGSGGGFPAVPLAVCRPKTRFLLYEKSPRKRKFLKSLTAVVSNIRVLDRLESGGLHPKTQWVVARAFKPIDAILALTPDFYRAGGGYLLYKGRRTGIEEELAQAGLRADHAAVLPLIPFGEPKERHLVVIRTTQT